MINKIRPKLQNLQDVCIKINVECYHRAAGLVPLKSKLKADRASKNLSCLSTNSGKQCDDLNNANIAN